MTAVRGVTVLALPAPAVERRSQPAIRDTVRYFDPALVVVPGPRSAMAEAAVREACPDRPVVHPQLGRSEDGISQHRYRPDTGVRAATGPPAADDIDVLAVQGADALPRLRAQLAAGDRQTGADAATLLVVPELSVEWDTTRLSATLPNGDLLADIRATLPEPVTVLAGGQPAEYSHQWSLPRDDTGPVSLPVAGLGATDRGGATFAQVTCTARGTVAAEAVDADEFGLTALTGVGPTTAGRLRDRGCRTVTDVRDVAVSELVTLPAVGRSTAEEIHAHADVIESGDPLVLTNREPVQTRDGDPPLCLDIETDGLSPTIIWQFGVYDPATDRYRAFLESDDPGDPASVLESFITWLLARHGNRTLLTWNGDGFDYPQIEGFLRRHHPGYLDAWADLRTADLYRWAVREGNALLPGRTNKLDHVARALGYDAADTGLTGAQTAAAYRTFARRPDDPAAEPDWERHRQYCEDDCRALWHVYEAIRDAPRRDVTDSGSGGARGQQVGLTDFQ